MKTRTDKEQERYLNELYFDIYSEGQAIDNFIYLTNKSRGAHTTEAHIRKCYNRRELGSLLRRLDPIAFQTSKND